MRKLWAKFLDALYPNGIKCVCCGNELIGTEKFGICKNCATYFVAQAGEICSKCSAPLKEGVCPDCDGKEISFRKLTSAYPYLGKVKNLILAYKEGGKPWISQCFSEILAEKIVASGVKYDAILYPPSSARTKKRRGFDHMLEVAKAVSAKTGIPLQYAFLRTEESKKQSELNRAERAENSQKAYVLTEIPAGKTFAIVDDVATTCATLFALAKEVKEEIPDAEIDCYTVARTASK